MKFSCIQENLARALAVVRRAVSSRSTIPVTQNVLLTAENSVLSIAATDLTMTMTSVIGANVEEEGSVTVPARLLADFVNSLPVERIDIESTKSPLGVHVECAGFESNISGRPAEDFPPIPTVTDGHVAVVNPKDFQQAISQVVFAAASDDNRPVLTGVFGEVEGNDMKLVAADGFRLAVTSVVLSDTPAEGFEFLVPARTLSEVGRLLNNQESDVEFTVTPRRTQVVFRLDEVEIVSTLLAGKFPAYSNLIPAAHSTQICANSDDFRRATRTASIFARDNGGIVRLQSEGSGGGEEFLRISAQSDEIGDNKGVIPVRIEGETESKIAFNVNYLTDVLDVVQGEVVMELSSAASPGVVKPGDSDDYKVVIMPMFVQWQ